MTAAFNYEQAFKRNIGWVTPEEQQLLRRRRVAVAGLGGCGGSHVTTLARLGVGAFTLADFDSSSWSISTGRPARGCRRWARGSSMS